MKRLKFQKELEYFWTIALFSLGFSLLVSAFKSDEVVILHILDVIAGLALIISSIITTPVKK